MASSSSSHIMASAIKTVYSYDVFLSFRGEDTRHSFTDHLYDALTRAGVHTFRDNEEIKRGEKISHEIELAIKGSRASIIVLSKNYATSTWCLDELSTILGQRKARDHFVLPIFYHVNPSDVKKQAVEVKSGSRWTVENVKLWKEGLKDVGELAGLVLEGSETTFLKKIIDTIECKLDRKYVHLPPNIIGMDTRYDEITSWLNQPNYEFLAICGMGGSGKTTLAKYIFNSSLKYFENVSFIEDIGSRCNRANDLLNLQEKLLKDILGGKERELPSVSRGTFKIQEVMQRKRTLIVLDDIVERSQILGLLGSGMINAQSKIIITTRNNTDNWFDSSYRCQKYQMELLNYYESLELFSSHAFGSKIPISGFERLAHLAVRYCEGNPLALQVLGSSLFMNNNFQSWISHFNLLEKEIDSRIQDILIRSYMSLPFDSQKMLFLHIACFYIGRDVDYVITILEHEYCAAIGIKTLINRHLVSVSPDKKLKMHRLIQQMGINIVRHGLTTFPEKSRVWICSESYRTMSLGKASNMIEAIDGRYRVIVLRVRLNFDPKMKYKVMKAVSALSGIESLSIDTEKETLTILGDLDPIRVVQAVTTKKCGCVELIRVGPSTDWVQANLTSIEDDFHDQQIS